MEIELSKEACTGCGTCVELCPEEFMIDDEGTAKPVNSVVNPENKHLVKEASEQCPTHAISLVYEVEELVSGLISGIRSIDQFKKSVELMDFWGAISASLEPSVYVAGLFNELIVEDGQIKFITPSEKNGIENEFEFYINEDNIISVKGHLESDDNGNILKCVDFILDNGTQVNTLLVI